MGNVEPQVATTSGAQQAAATTDGFQLVIDALKLNGIDTIFGLPGIPITDLTRRAQAEGMRVLSFRHEQNAGYAASIAGFLTQKPGICLTVSAPGFLNGLNALAHATTNCFPMILISGSPRPPTGCCTPRTSASASRAPSAPPSPAARAACTSTCRASCLRKAWTPRPAGDR